MRFAQPLAWTVLLALCCVGAAGCVGSALHLPAAPPGAPLPNGGAPDFRWAYVIGWGCLLAAIASVVFNSFLQTTPKLTGSLVLCGVGSFVLGYFLTRFFTALVVLACITGGLFLFHVLYVSVNWKDSEWGCVVNWIKARLANRRARTTMP